MKKAYKVFNKDWTCRDYNFKNENGCVEGTIHEVKGKPVLCNNGFHYCINLVDCFNYYDFNNENKVAEIEILGNIANDGRDKECSTKIKILREVSWFEVLEKCNTGNGNTGNRNTGNWNTGDRNTGNWNTGNWNSGNDNTGFFNSITPKEILVFNKKCKMKDWDKADKPNFLYFKLTEWVSEEEMTQFEKDKNPVYHYCGGYLKEYTYKEAFMK